MEVLKQRNESTLFMVSLTKSDKALLVKHAKEQNTTMSSLLRFLIRTKNNLNDLENNIFYK